MLKRLGIYCKEMFPILINLSIGIVVFFEIYFVLLLNYGVTQFNINIQEFIGGLTLFAYLFLLRIVDDFKDYKTDKILFPERPLPSGRVKKKDLIILGIFILLLITVLNIVFMNNIIFFLFVFLYGVFMSLLFCYSEKLKKNFILMMFTHTPFLILMNLYVISFTCIKYGLEAITHITFFISFTIYFIGFIRGIAKEVKGAQNTLYLGMFAVLDTIINIILLWNLNIILVGILIINLIWFLVKVKQFAKNSESFKMLNKAVIYVLIQESTMILSVVWYLLI